MIAAQLLDYALKAGAEHAAVLQENSTALSVAHRLGKTEKLEHSYTTDIGLRVIIGGRSATVSGSDFRTESLKELAEQAVTLAKYSPIDEYALIATENLASHVPDLNIYDATMPSAEQLLSLCAEAETAALAIKGISNSEGAEASVEQAGTTLCTSAGFEKSYKESSSSLAVSVLAGANDTEGMERDYDYSVATHFNNLKDAKITGESAANRAIKRLNPGKMPTGKYPIIVDPRVAGSLLRSFAGAINGRSIIRGSSFLKDYLNKKVFNENITIIDNPHLQQGMRSQPFDGEGVECRALNIVEKGHLNYWLLDTATSKQLKIPNNARAAFNLGGTPAPTATNMYIENGAATPQELIADIQDGFYLSETMGMGINGLTGDYSQGAAGFRIQNGKITQPVNNVTVAGTLQQIFASIIAANDLEHKTGIDSPTLLIPSITVAG